LAEQYATASKNDWGSEQKWAVDGSCVFLGKKGESLVLTPSFKIYRGRAGRGVGEVNGNLLVKYELLEFLGNARHREE
jgi:hypothetical protein